MSAQVIKLTGTSDVAAVDAAVAALEAGQLVVIPTETVYGLVANPRVSGSVEQIYTAKQRDRGKPLQMLVSGMDVIEAMGFRLSDVERRLAERFWPGGLTLIVESEDRSEGFRIPDSEIAIEISARVGGALWATSANSSGDPAALTAAEAVACLGDSVAVVLDGGAVADGIASTVARVDSQGYVEVLREGAISRKLIMSIGSSHA